ncbi:MAG: FlgO family outer membrane protein [Gammaproteobacteria bacterium]
MRMRFLVLFCTVLLVGGCASSDSDVPKYQQVRDSDLVSQSYTAAEALLEQVPWLKENRQPLLTGTFVNINSMEDSSAMGRMIAEQISSRFAQDGFTMVEMKLRRNVFIQQQGGEFVLSREVQSLSQVHNAAAVIAGTYAVGRRTVYINARLVRAADNLVLAAYDYSMPLGPDAKALLASE